MTTPAKRVPTRAADAKPFVKAAFAAGRYEFDTGRHFARRLAERKLSVDEPALGDLLYLDDDQEWALCVTIIDEVE